MDSPYLKFENISKEFPGVKALQNINVDFYQGEIHAICGENGAGKSTLLKILSGVYTPNQGRIILNGEVKKFTSPKDALDEGICIVYQELNLIKELTVAENILLGHFPSKILNKKENNKKVQKILDMLDEYSKEDKDFKDLENSRIDANVKTKEYSIAKQQMIEISKSLLMNVKVIAFDEPTSSISEKEKRQLFRIIKKFKDENCVIIYISHRMEEIFEVSDKISIFRDGQFINTYKTENVTEGQLIKDMVGRDIQDIYDYRKRQLGDEILRVEHIKNQYGVANSFSLKKGEILGVFGLIGAGRTEMIRTIFGADKKTSGLIFIEGEEVKIKGTNSAVGHKIAFLPEDRKKEGIFSFHSIKNNINIVGRKDFSLLHSIIVEKKESQMAKDYVEKLRVATPNINKKIGELSGGNQQKVIIARWLMSDIDIFIIDEPTRGIDVGSKSEIYQLMYKLTEEGKTIIMVSSDLPEVMGVSDRMLIMANNKIVDILDREDFDQHRILSLALTKL